MKFFVGLHHPADARGFDHAMVSVNALLTRKSDFHPRGEWMLDSGAFMQIKQHGEFVLSLYDYASAIKRWRRCGNMVAAVSQDYMCESFVLARTGRTVAEHQHATICRYCTLRFLVRDAAYLMPVLQGFEPWEYVAHVRQYGSMLAPGQWVGVGSVCKRNSRVEDVERVLLAIREERPDLRLHGFGLKITALESSIVRDCLHSADSMAWSYAARREGRKKDVNDPAEAARYAERIRTQEPVTRQCQRRLEDFT